MSKEIKDVADDDANKDGNEVLTHEHVDDNHHKRDVKASHRNTYSIRRGDESYQNKKTKH